MSDKNNEKRKLYDEVVKKLEEKNEANKKIDTKNKKNAATTISNNKNIKKENKEKEAKKAIKQLDKTETGIKDKKENKSVDDFFMSAGERKRFSNTKKDVDKQKENKNEKPEGFNLANDLSEEDQKYIKKVNDKRLKTILIFQILIIAILIYTIVSKMSLIKTDMEDLKTGSFNEVGENLELQLPDQIPEEFEGRKVLGELIIENISLKQYIFENENDNLDKGVTLFHTINGINSVGNTSLIGHNDNGVFDKLKDLEKEAEIKIRTNNNGNKEYIVKETGEIDEDDFRPMLSEKRREITLITCIKGKDSKRLYVKAEEK